MRCCKPYCHAIAAVFSDAADSGGRLFRDQDGFTTTSMVLSLLITLSLVFTAAQVYRINSASAEVQDVADAAALAAENQVAEFMIVARFCDAVVLSLSLSGIAVCGLGIAAMCTPATAAASEGLIEAGKKLIEARNEFAERARSVLDKLQEALPFLAASCSAAVSAANNADSSGASYLGIAVLVPSKGELVDVGSGESADKLVDDIDDKADEIRKRAEEAEEASRKANEAKQRAFLRDCGDNPQYCMYERAFHLAGLSGASNPLFSSIDTWSFSAALARAEQYYAYRAGVEKPESNSTVDMTRWRLRVNFYEYAESTIRSEGFVHEDGDGYSANFPQLPSNTAEMRQTSLYTDRVYPITEAPLSGEDDEGDGSSMVMHAWAGCPGASGEVISYESLSYMESADLRPCPVCDFTPSSMGSVAAASTSIQNGFEYHYKAVARESAIYQEERKRADGPTSAVKKEAGFLFNELTEALKEAVGRRIEVSPPGSFGAVALVVNSGKTSTAGGFASRFVPSDGSLGPRAAISASTLVDEGSDEGRTVINSLIDGLRQDGGAAVGAFGIVLDMWSHALSAYSNGVDSIADGVESGLNSLPLAGASGLGTWASGILRDALEGIGLQPAKLGALKPALVNSAHVAAKGEGSAMSGLIDVKQRVVAHPLYSTDLFSAILTDAEKEALDQIDGLGDSIELMSIELFGNGGLSIPLTIPLPEEVKGFGRGALQDIFGRLRSHHAETVEVRAWE